jgi:dTDP-4-dehydrorhamnose reductase
MKKVLVLGASGLLGTRVCDAFLKSNFEVYATVHSREINSDCVPIKALLSDFAEVKKLLRQDFEVIVNCAGLTNVDSCELRPEAAWQLNATLPSWLAKLSYNSRSRFIHISTDHFKSELDVPRSEEALIAPVNTYGYSKLGGEGFVLNFNPMASVLRTNFFGVTESGDHSLLDYLVDKFRHKQSLIGFVDVNFSPIGVTELARRILEISSIELSGLVNAAGPESITKYDFALAVADKLGASRTLISRGLAADAYLKSRRPNYLVLDSSRLSKSIRERDISLDKMLDEELTHTI